VHSLDDMPLREVSTERLQHYLAVRRAREAACWNQAEEENRLADQAKACVIARDMIVGDRLPPEVVIQAVVAQFPLAAEAVGAEVRHALAELARS
jgi:hypothetical protein